MVNLIETKGMVLVKDVIDIQRSITIMAMVTGCLVMRRSNPPSNNNLKKKTNITPNNKGSVGKVSAAYSLNSTVNEKGVKNRMK